MAQILPMPIFYDAALPAPNPRRVRIYLAEKEIEVPTKQVVIFAGEHKSPEYLAKYPQGQVPILELDDGRVIGESVSICRYFEALHPDPPLFGTDAFSMATIDMWLRRIDLNLGQSIRHIWMHTHPLTARVVNPQYKDFGESHRQHAITAMARIDAVLADQSYIAGDSFSMADISTLATLDFGIFIGMGIPDDHANLRDWHTRVSARPSAAA